MLLSNLIPSSLFNSLFFIYLTTLAVAYFPIENVISELLSHFTFQFFICSIIFILIFFILKNWKLALLNLGIIVYTSTLLYPFFIPHKINQSDSFEDIHILQFNIYYKNNEVKKFIDWIDTIHSTNEKATDPIPDIIVIQEVTPQIAHKLDLLSKYYPYKICAPEINPRGMYLLSKIPIKHFDRKSVNNGSNKFTNVSLITHHKKIPFELYELHAASPPYAQRQLELQSIANIIAKSTKTHKILLGDLNTTPYSPYFKNLVKTSGLTSAMIGNYVQGTWPSFLPQLLRIPIDHLLTSNGIETLSRNVCHSFGSDHLPVMTQLRIHYKTE